MTYSQGHSTLNSADVGEKKATRGPRGARKLRKRHLLSGTAALGVAGLILVATAVPVAAILSATTTTTEPSPAPSTTSTVPVVRQTPTVTSRARIDSARQRAHTRELAQRRAHLAARRAAERHANVTLRVQQPSTPTSTTVASTPKVVSHPSVPTTVPTPKPAVVSHPSVPTTTQKPVKKPKPSTKHAVAAGPSAAARSLMAHLNPSQNIAPSPNFMSSGPCTSQNGVTTCANPCITASMTWPTFTDAPACNNYILTAINNARGVEGLAPMSLPSNWYSLSTPQQLFVVVNLERTARGLPAYAGINATLSAAAQHAAATNSDPALAPGFSVASTGGVPAWGAAWSGGFSVLAADYIWMYDDGWAGSRAATSNVACTSPNAGGCWGHRDELLGYDPGYNPGVGLDSASVEVGVGFATVGHASSFTVLLELPSSTPPAMNFTWANNVAPNL